MDNEILIAIEALADRMSSMENKMNSMEKNLTNEINGVREDLTDEIDGLKQEVLKTNLIIENEIIPSIQFLADGHKGIIRRLDSLESKTDEMASTVLALDIIHTRK